jgi:phthiodiolone/phenolphthiodiolone dimycocerosates ketoreductase
MRKVTVGYQDACIHPLWLTNAGLRMARLFGAESLWLPDHYMSFVPSQVWTPEITKAAKLIHSPDAFFDPVQILAVAATRMRGVDVGTLVTEPFRRHPMSIAQSFVTLDHISRGRAVLGIGNGERENVEPYGLPWNKQVSRLEEALTIILKLWESRGKPVSYDGSFWKLRDAVFNLPLYDDRPPRIWIAAHAPRMLALTGRFGDGWVPTLRSTPEEYARRLGVIREAAEGAGRSFTRFTAGQVIPCAIGESREQMLEAAMTSRLGAALTLLVPAEVWREHGKKHPLGDDHKGFIDIVPSRVTDEQIDAAAREIVPEILLASLYMGNPAEIRDEIAPLVHAGARHLIVANMGAALTGGGPRDIMRLASLIRKLRRL